MSKHYQPEGRFQVTSLIAVILLLLILFVSVSYFFFLAKPDEQARRLEMQEEFEAARALWASERPDSFRYVVDRACDCPDEDSRAYLVTERGGRRSAEFPIPVESSAGILITTPPRPVWLEDIFETVERALRSNTAIEVRYETVFGYPETVILGPDEQYEIRDFEITENR